MGSYSLINFEKKSEKPKIKIKIKIKKNYKQLNEQRD